MTTDNTYDIAGADKFNLDPAIHRLPHQRVAMVTDADCPYRVLEIVAQYDQDSSVLLAVLSAALCDEHIEKLVAANRGLEDLASLEELKITNEESNHSSIVAVDDPMHKTFCSIPWVHAGTNANGSVRACCQMIFPDPLANTGLVTKEDGSLLTFDDKIAEHRNERLWKTVRSDMLKGKRSSVCKLCWNEEDASVGENASSKRIYANKLFPEAMENAVTKTKEDGTIDHNDFPIEWWDLRFGNKCNLKCRTCGPSNSDLWYKDHRDMKVEDGHGKITVDLDGEKAEIVTNKKGQLEIPHMKSWYEGSQLWMDINNNIADIKRIYFTGGEPTINHKHRELLENIISKGYAGEVDLEYNTNMAASSKSYFEIWKSFKSVHQGLSLDGMGSHFEYIRHPGKWTKTERLLKELDSAAGLDHLQANITLTCSVMNVFHIPDFMYWLKEQNFSKISNEMHVHLVYGPAPYSIQYMPERLKFEINEMYERFISHIWKRWPEDKCTTHDMLWCDITEQTLRQVLGQMWSVESNAEHWNNFKRLTTQLDKLRKEDWQESLPDLAAAIGRMNDAEQRKQRTKLSDYSNKKVIPPKI